MNRSTSLLLSLALLCAAPAPGQIAPPPPTSITGNAATATALQNTPVPCSAGNYPLGVDVSGNSINCTAVSSVGPPSRKGSVVISNLSQTTSTNNVSVSGELESIACTATAPVYWPVAGYFRSASLSTNATNGQTITKATVFDCFSSVTTTSDVFVPPLAAAGGFVDSFAGNYSHSGAGGAPFFAWGHTGAANTALNAISAEFIDDGAAYASVLGAQFNTATTASTTKFLGFAGGGAVYSTTELATAIPIPFAATVLNPTLCTTAGPPTTSIPVVLRKNGANTTATFTIASTDVAAGCYTDSTHTVSVVAGDYIDYSVVTGATTQSTIATYFVEVTPTSGTTTMMGALINSTVTTTNKYSMPGSSVPTTTLANGSMTMPIVCTASNLYVVQAVANGAGVTTTFTLEKNSADTAVTGTITSGSGTGAIAVDTTHSVAFSKGDLMTLKYITGSGTSGTIGGWAIQCQ